MCTCLSGVKKDMAQHLADSQKGKAQVSDVDYVNAGFFNLNNTLVVQPVLEFSYKRAKVKADGTYGRPTKAIASMTFTYCPFCGVKYDA